MSDHTSEFLETAAKAAADVVGGAAGQAVVTIVSEFGRRIVTYWAAGAGSPEVAVVQSTQLPPYAIVGIGRCGSHVSAELAGMLLASQPASSTNDSTLRLAWLTSWLSRDKDGAHVPPKPMMIIGDIDETTFPDVAQYFRKGQTLEEEVAYEQLDYRPLAHGGAGHVPAFGEFITRGLLLLAPYDAERENRPWAEARRYLLEVCSTGRKAPRLVFYVFSSGGGTGSGAAAELVRAQRVAMALSPAPEPEIYLTGMTILPRGLLDGKNRRYLINSGRLFIQYLAEINITLSSVTDYSAAQVVRYQFAVSDCHGEAQPIRPLDSLGVVSNEAMFRATDTAAELATTGGATYERAEAMANRYIAQQVFALAASQIRQQQVDGDTDSNTDDEDSDRNRIRVADGIDFQSTRLDPHDLKTSLRGPYAIAFGVAEADELAQPGGIDRLFLNAVSLPSMRTGRGARTTNEVITGLSVLPTDDLSAYHDEIAQLGQRASGEPLKDTDFSVLRAIPLFANCPRVVFVVNTPDDAELDSRLPHRVCQLIGWAMPRLNEARYAVVRQSTGFFGLSIFVQGSVVLSPELQKAMRNFVKLAWSCRGERAAEFNAKFDELLSAPPPLDDEAIRAWIGDREQYHLNVDEFDASVKELQKRWRAFVDQNEANQRRKKELLEHEIEGCMLTHQDIAAALRYINYVHNLTAADIA